MGNAANPAAAIVIATIFSKPLCITAVGWKKDGKSTLREGVKKKTGIKAGCFIPVFSFAKNYLEVLQQLRLQISSAAYFS